MPVVLDQLTHEWTRMADDPRLAAQLTDVCRVLGVATLAELRVVIDDASYADKDAVMLLLARRAVDGHALAARVLLHLLWPGVLRLTRTWQAIGDDDERAAAVLSAVYARICSYPVERRPRAVAANILLDAAKELRRAARPIIHETLGRLDDLEAISESREDMSAGEALAAVVADAVEVGTLSRTDAALVLGTRVFGRSLTEFHPHGTSTRTMQRRRKRAERALIAAAAA